MSADGSRAEWQENRHEQLNGPPPGLGWVCHECGRVPADQEGGLCLRCWDDAEGDRWNQTAEWDYR